MVRSTAFGLLALLLWTPALYAQQPNAPVKASIRASVERLRFDEPRTAPATTAIRFRRQNAMSAATKASVAFVGGLLGFFAGGLIGAGLEPNCGCDDPGLRGFTIGAPIGAVLGGIVAYRLASP
jgi:hypothetical protein